MGCCASAEQEIGVTGIYTIKSFDPNKLEPGERKSIRKKIEKGGIVLIISEPWYLDSYCYGCGSWRFILRSPYGGYGSARELHRRYNKPGLYELV